MIFSGKVLHFSAIIRVTFALTKIGCKQPKVYHMQVNDGILFIRSAKVQHLVSEASIHADLIGLKQVLETGLGQF